MEPGLSCEIFVIEEHRVHTAGLESNKARNPSAEIPGVFTPDGDW